jgi:hypothetical protein
VSHAITNEMPPKEPHNARVEIAVKGCPVEDRRHVGANARHCGRELPRAGRQEGKVAGRNGVNVGLARQVAGGVRGARCDDAVATETAKSVAEFGCRSGLRSVSLQNKASLRKSGWTRGKELANHRQFTLTTNIDVYFCDPQSPWQRGSNENTNGLLRQYFPRGTDSSVHWQAHLNKVARQLNERPRETLQFETPAERFNACVASTG